MIKEGGRMSYKEYDFIKAQVGDYSGAIYKDNMFGMEFTNVSVYDKNNIEIFHATLDNDKKYTEEDVIKFIVNAVDMYKEIKLW